MTLLLSEVLPVAVVSIQRDIGVGAGGYFAQRAGGVPKPVLALASRAPARPRRGAAAIQPQEAKWLLMVASCYRRMGAYQKALSMSARGAARPSLRWGIYKGVR